MTKEEAYRVLAAVDLYRGNMVQASYQSLRELLQNECMKMMLEEEYNAYQQERSRSVPGLS